VYSGTLQNKKTRKNMEKNLEDKQRQNHLGNYQLSRLNATRHGILSREPVLPWEDPEEYENLHLALRQEHEPVGPTEEYLVEEIAGIIWRKGRLVQAENSAFRDGYRSALILNSLRIAESGVLDARRLIRAYSLPMGGLQEMFLGALTVGQENSDYALYLDEILAMNPEEAAQELEKVRKHIQGCQQARNILTTQGSEAYQLALDTLSAPIRNCWEDEVGEEEDNPRPEDLGKFLDVTIAELKTHESLLTHHRDILAQAQGESLRPAYLERLSRYETSLNRRMERTLAMLLSLQDRRHSRKTPAIKLSRLCGDGSRR
jgi:hypothetical protein